MSHGRYELSQLQWELIKEVLPLAPLIAGRGRLTRSDREMLNGIFWILCSGSPWRDLPERYGPWQTVYDRFRRWQQQGVFEHILTQLRLKLQSDGYLGLNTWFADATINKAHKAAAGAKKRRQGFRALKRRLFDKSAFVMLWQGLSLTSVSEWWSGRRGAASDLIAE